MSDAQIFQIVSLVYIAVGIGILINPEFYKKLLEDFVEDAPFLYLGGIAALVAGYLILAFHGAWTMDLSVVITIFGWIALIKGILILVQPNIMIALSKAMTKNKSILRIWAVVAIVLGPAFSFLGFRPKSPV
ncbi:MAG: hypothetical protein JSU70_14630 [Phycisphaerales bacterium]|nr:MAG: hypothetical protein JSU70_14630 [Phycisphaerales bacterium]